MKKWLLPVLFASMFFYFGCGEEAIETAGDDTQNGPGSGMVGEEGVDAVGGEGVQIAAGDSTVYNCSNPSNESDILVTLKESDSEDGAWACGKWDSCHCSLVAEGTIGDNIYSQDYPLFMSPTHGSNHCSLGLEQLLNNDLILNGNTKGAVNAQGGSLQIDVNNPVHNAEGAESMWTCEAQQVAEEAEESEEEVGEEAQACNGGKNEEEKLA